ncbi:MAG: NAD(+)/NADH kinase [Thioalkalivibrio sp.]|nr:NAD(+)/NADH kinase [Thioalkalivibrio sp.]
MTGAKVLERPKPRSQAEQETMRAFVVLNPVAGQSDDKSVRETLETAFAEHRIRYEVYETSDGDNPGDVVRSRLGDGFDLVVAVGGDGTVSAVIDGLVETQVPLGIIPSGTGNLIARELGIPTELDAAIALIAGTPRPRAVDAMRVGERVFVLNVSVGVSAEVVSDTSSKEKSRLGRLAYTWTTFRKLFDLEHRRFDIVVDGTAHEHRAVPLPLQPRDAQALRLPVARHRREAARHDPQHRAPRGAGGRGPLRHDAGRGGAAAARRHRARARGRRECAHVGSCCRGPPTAWLGAGMRLYCAKRPDSNGPRNGAPRRPDSRERTPAMMPC